MDVSSRSIMNTNEFVQFDVKRWFVQSPIFTKQREIVESVGQSLLFVLVKCLALPYPTKETRGPCLLLHQCPPTPIWTEDCVCMWLFRWVCHLITAELHEGLAMCVQSCWEVEIARFKLWPQYQIMLENVA